ncbi:MAG: hypothetical protein M0Q95_01240 [Porticoccaceae bacterium]|nr:hypothetical protein [Porticoccaceae bacterium]
MNNVGKSARTVNTYWIHTNNSDIVGISANALEPSGAISNSGETVVFLPTPQPGYIPSFILDGGAGRMKIDASKDCLTFTRNTNKDSKT